MTILPRLLAGVYALVLIMLCVTAYLTIRYAGYPDGFVSPYEEAIRVPLIICNTINLLAAVFFIREAFRKRAALIRVCIAIVIHVIFLMAYSQGLDWYFKSYLGLDQGQGA